MRGGGLTRSLEVDGRQVSCSNTRFYLLTLLRLTSSRSSHQRFSVTYNPCVFVLMKRGRSCAECLLQTGYADDSLFLMELLSICLSKTHYSLHIQPFQGSGSLRPKSHNRDKGSAPLHSCCVQASRMKWVRPAIVKLNNVRAFPSLYRGFGDTRVNPVSSDHS